MPESSTKTITRAWPADWDKVLDTAIRTWGGEWNTKRVQHLFSARYGGGIFRDAARECLSHRAHTGQLTLHDRPNGRFYTRNSRKDGHS